MKGEAEVEWNLTAHLTWDQPDPRRITSFVVGGVEFVPKASLVNAVRRAYREGWDCGYWRKGSYLPQAWKKSRARAALQKEAHDA